jgi:hypothetical protein
VIGRLQSSCYLKIFSSSGIIYLWIACVLLDWATGCYMPPEYFQIRNLMISSLKRPNRTHHVPRVYSQVSFLNRAKKYHPREFRVAKRIRSRQEVTENRFKCDVHITARRMHGEFHALAVPIKGGAQIGPQKPRQENVCSILDVLKDKENISSHATLPIAPCPRATSALYILLV